MAKQKCELFVVWECGCIGINPEVLTLMSDGTESSDGLELPATAFRFVVLWNCDQDPHDYDPRMFGIMPRIMEGCDNKVRPYRVATPHEHRVLLNRLKEAGAVASAATRASVASNWLDKSITNYLSSPKEDAIC